jgi:hypothetical protein
LLYTFAAAFVLAISKLLLPLSGKANREAFYPRLANDATGKEAED